MKRKTLNRAALSAEFGLEVPGPLAIVVSRLTDQKGIDLLPARRARLSSTAAGGWSSSARATRRWKAAMRRLPGGFPAGWR